MARGNPPSIRTVLAGFGARLRGGMGWLLPLENPPGGGPEAAPVGMEAAPRFFLLFLALFAGGMILISLLGDQGLISFFRLRGEAQRLTTEVAELQQQQKELGRRIRALREDPGYIELLARQRLGLVHPGDVIIQLPRREQP